MKTYVELAWAVRDFIDHGEKCICDCETCRIHRARVEANPELYPANEVNEIRRAMMDKFIEVVGELGSVPNPDLHEFRNGYNNAINDVIGELNKLKETE